MEDPDAGYLDVKETFGIVSSDDREDYKSDTAYANYRELSGGKLKRGILYRSASPIDNIYGRVPYVVKLIEADGVRFVLDLADNADAIWDFATDNAANGVDDSYFMGLYETGNVTCLGLSTDYETEGYGETLAYGLSQLAEHDGPYLLHCMVGKDRTGFACALVEALAGATYDEIEADYMITYDNYYGITKTGTPAEYRAIRARNLDPILRFITGASADEDLATIDYTQAARTFLRDNGMDDAQIDKLVERICG